MSSQRLRAPRARVGETSIFEPRDERKALETVAGGGAHLVAVLGAVRADEHHLEVATLGPQLLVDLLERRSEAPARRTLQRHKQRRHNTQQTRHTHDTGQDNSNVIEPVGILISISVAVRVHRRGLIRAH